MKIARVRIQNYRSVQDVTFSPGDICALIGGNNAGKSNVLKAINLVLGSSWPTTRPVSEQDFYGYDEHRDIGITIWFDEPQETRGDVGDRIQVAGIKFTVSRYQRASGKHARGDLKSDFVCVDNDGTPIQVLKKWRRDSKPVPMPAPVSSSIRDALPVVMIDVDRNSDYHLSGSQWSLLGRLLAAISKKLKTDAVRYAEFQEKIQAARQVLHTQDFEKLRTKVVEQIQKHTGLSGITLDLDAIDPINLYKSFSVLFKDAASPQPVEVGRMGSGIQSAVVISLLQAYRELHKDNAVLLFEEPELFLHPHGRRHLFRLLCELAAEGTQVIYTTHSQDFVDLEQLDSVRIASKTASDGTRIVAPDPIVDAEDWRKTMKLTRALGSPRNEMFFADSVVLVEGPSEEAAIACLSRLMPEPLELDRLNCSVLNAGSKNSLPMLARAARCLGKRILVIYDTDSDTTSDEQNERRKQAILDAMGERGSVFELEPNLEMVADAPPATNDKEVSIIRYLNTMRDWSAVPLRLREMMIAIASLAGGPPGTKE